MRNKRNGILTFALLLTAAFCFRVSVARLLPNDEPGDSKIYTQIARNVLEQHVYSHATEPPFEPSLIRLPGYPLFLAGILRRFWTRRQHRRAHHAGADRYGFLRTDCVVGVLLGAGRKTKTAERYCRAGACGGLSLQHDLRSYHPD